MKYNSSLKHNLKKIQEARVMDRIFPDVGEVAAVSKTGAFGIQIYLDARGVPKDGQKKVHWNITTTYDGPYNTEANRDLWVPEEDVEKIIKKHADDFKAVIKRGIERIDDDIEAMLKKLGYK